MTDKQVIHLLTYVVDGDSYRIKFATRMCFPKNTGTEWLPSVRDILCKDPKRVTCKRCLRHRPETKRRKRG